MKPIKLIISAFGPYPDVVTVDFSSLQNGGVLLIGGDTGAGKTTLFDAISFALFGDVSGEGRKNVSMRSDFATPSAKTYVILTFLHKGQSYTVERSPAYLRAKERGDGFTQKPADASLALPNGKILTKVGTINSYISQLLCMDHSQFKQISMIAQGEFLKLIGAKGSERQAILRRVFGTGVYESATQKLKEQYTASMEAAKASESHIVRLFEGMSFEQPPLQNTDFYELKAMEQFAKQDIESRKKTLETLSQKRDEIAKQRENVAAQRQQDQQTNQLFEQLENWEKQALQLGEKQEQMQQQKLRVQRAGKASECVKPYQLYKQAKQQYSQNQTAQSGANQRLQEAINQVEIAAQGVMSIDEKNIQVQSLGEKILLAQNNLPLYEKRQTLQQQLLTLTQNGQKSKLAVQQGQQTLEKLQQQMRQEEEKISSKQALLDQQQTAREQHLQLAAHIEQLQHIEQALTQVGQYTAKAQAAKEKFLAHRQVLSQSQDKLSALRLAQLEAQAGILASQLACGAPCPVCGSTHHPKKAQMVQQADQEQVAVWEATVEEQLQSGQKLAMSVQQWDTLLKQAQQDVKNVGLQSMTQEQCTQQLHQLCQQKSTLQENLQTLERQISLANEAQENKNQLGLDIETLRENMQKWQDIQTNLQVQSAACQASLDSFAHLEHENAHMATQKLSQMLNAKQELQVQIESALSQQARANEAKAGAQASLSQAKAACENSGQLVLLCQGELEQALSHRGFSLEDFLAAQMSFDDMQAVQEQIQAYENSVYQAKENIARLQEQVKGKTQVDLNVGQQLADQLAADQSQLQQQIGKLQGVLAHNQSNLQQMCKEGERSLDIRQQTAQLNLLFQTASGKLAGKAKISFEQYVQANYFEHVIQAANRRFVQITGGRYKLCRFDDPDDLSSGGALELNVLDHYTGKQRSVRSLSGGESFMAALCLALGFSDVVVSFAGGVEIDALFIDEGFGSLDEDALQHAVDVLRSLAGENRLVGIISHVKELSGQIDRQLWVKNMGFGSNVTSNF